MKDTIKFTDIESQWVTIFFGIILIIMTIFLNSTAGLLWASIFAAIGVLSIYLRAWRRSVNALKFSLPAWLAGSDVMVQFNISIDILIEHIQNGLPAYPAGILHDVTRDEAPPIDDVEWLLSSPTLENDFELLCFKTIEVEKFIKRNPT